MGFCFFGFFWGGLIKKSSSSSALNLEIIKFILIPFVLTKRAKPLLLVETTVESILIYHGIIIAFCILRQIYW